MSKRHTAGQAFASVMKSDPRTKAGWERARAMLQAFQSLLRSPEYRKARESEQRELRDLAAAFEAEIRGAASAIQSGLQADHFRPPETIEHWEHLARIIEIPPDSIGQLTAAGIFELATAWADRQRIRAKLVKEVESPVTATPTMIPHADAAAKLGITGTPKSVSKAMEKVRASAQVAHELRGAEYWYDPTDIAKYAAGRKSGKKSTFKSKADDDESAESVERKCRQAGL